MVKHIELVFDYQVDPTMEKDTELSSSFCILMFCILPSVLWHDWASGRVSGS